jgi:glycosyltransferase involved in cell wall biosynthesis
MPFPITLIAIVHNAQGKIKQLIERHKDVVSETIIIDQGSTDGTYEEALQCADKVFRRRRKGAADPDRNWAFELGSQPYVLYLDDDEYLSAEAKEKIPEIVATDADIFWFKRDNFVDGININEILGDDIQCRLFKKGAVKFPNRIHRFPTGAMDTRVFYLDCAIRHDRTLEGLIKANKAREVIADEKEIENQNKFIELVEKLVKAAK